MVAEYKPQVTLESAHKYYAAKSEILDYSFGETIGVDRNVPDGNTYWVDQTTSPVKLYNGVPSGTPTFPIYYNGALPRSFVIDFTVNPSFEWTNPLYIQVKGTSDFSSYIGISLYPYILATSGHDGTMYCAIWCNGMFTGLQNVYTKTYPIHYIDSTHNLSNLPLGGKLRVAVYESQYESDTSSEIYIVAYWCETIIGVASFTNVPAASVKNYMSISEGFSKIRLSDLAEIIPYTSSDPGENFYGAIQRAIEDRYINSFTRGNGTLRCYVPFGRYINDSLDNVTTSLNGIQGFIFHDSTQTLISSGKNQPWWNDDCLIIQAIGGLSLGKPDTNLVPNDKTSDWNFLLSDETDVIYAQALSHIRLTGAFNWVQLEDPMFSELVGHKSKEINSTSSFTTAADYQQALLFFAKMYESIVKRTIVLPGAITLEPNDMVVLNAVNTIEGFQVFIPFWVDQISISSVPGKSYNTTLNLRGNAFVQDPLLGQTAEFSGIVL